ncbi:hypothetical protein [Streptomyces nitrosporeus]|uniref:hypothetical protein n=1 Tax=Streptomyces nitrosporeus TaxID=28894 RepID=UPI0039A2B732
MDRWITFWTALWVGSSRLTHRTVNWLCNARPKPPPKSAPEPAKEPPADSPEAGESDEQPETGPGEQPKAKKKAAKAPTKKPPAEAEGSALLRWAGLLIAAAVAKGLPYTTTLALGLAAAWVLTALILGYAAALPAKEPAAAAETPAEEAPADTRHPRDILTRDHVARLLADVYTEGSGVHLATLAEHLTRTPLVGLPPAPWKTADVRALLARHEVRVRDGVRVPPKGGREGVHREDFPPLPPTPSGEPVVGVVVPGQGNNNNPGNGPSYVIEDDPEHPVRHTVRHV